MRPRINRRARGSCASAAARPPRTTVPRAHTCIRTFLAVPRRWATARSAGPGQHHSHSHPSSSSSVLPIPVLIPLCNTCAHGVAWSIIYTNPSIAGQYKNSRGVWLKESSSLSISKVLVLTTSREDIDLTNKEEHIFFFFLKGPTWVLAALHLSQRSGLM